MEFTRIDIRNNRDEFIKTMQDMLSVLDNHCIYISHPNNILNEPIKFNGNQVIVNWDDINSQKMMEKDEKKTFTSFQEQDAYRHVYNRLVHDFSKQKEDKGKENAIAYLAIVEKYRYDSKDNYLVRGIIRADMDGISFLFNPEFLATITHNPFEIGLRLGDDERTIPIIYKKTRKG